MVAEKFGIEEIRDVANRELIRTEVTNTFHGRDVMAPVAGYISKGLEISEVGPKLSEIERIDFDKPVVKDNRIIGKIINIDNFGNIVTNIGANIVEDSIEAESKIVIEIDTSEIEATFVKTFGDVEKGEKICYIGSANFLEIAKNQESLAREINAKEKDDLSIWINRKNKQEKIKR